MKRILTIVLSLITMFAVVGCARSNGKTDDADISSKGSEPIDSVETYEDENQSEAVELYEDIGDYKIAVLAANEIFDNNDLLLAEKIAKQSDSIIVESQTDEFLRNSDILVSKVAELSGETGVRALLLNYAPPGTSLAIDKARKINPDILIIVINPLEDLSLLSDKADIILQTDQNNIAKRFISNASNSETGSLVYHYLTVSEDNDPRDENIEMLKSYAERKNLNFAAKKYAIDLRDADGYAVSVEKTSAAGSKALHFSTDLCLFNALAELDADMSMQNSSLAELNALMLEVGIKYAEAYLDNATNSRNDFDELILLFNEYSPSKLSILSDPYGDSNVENIYAISFEKVN